MGGRGAEDNVCREVKELLIEGAKYSASEDLEKAVKCYAKVLDLESQKPEPYILLARCLYQVGLKKNDIFGGGQDEENEDLEESGEEDEDESMSEDEETSNANRSGAPSLNSRLYQFDHEEEEELEGEAIAVGAKEQYAEEGEEEEEEEEGDEEEDTCEGGDDDIAPADGFENYLRGNVFENALELLYRARIMYMDSKSPSEEMPLDLQKKLVEIYKLLGDIDLELEDFAQSVRDYEEAIRICQAVHSQESNDEILKIYMELAEALRWMDPTSDDCITPKQHKEHLIKIKRLLKARIKDETLGESKEYELHLQRIEEDLLSLKEKPLGTALDKNAMMQAILKQALEATQQGKVNDLSKMVKKNRKRPL